MNFEKMILSTEKQEVVFPNKWKIVTTEQEVVVDAIVGKYAMVHVKGCIPIAVSTRRLKPLS